MRQAFSFLAITLFFFLACLGLSASPSFAQSFKLCTSTTSPKLDIAAAAAVPALVNGEVSTLGQGEASSEASALTSGTSVVCTQPPSLLVAGSIKKADSLWKHGQASKARKVLHDAMSALKKKKAPKLASLQGSHVSLISLDSNCPDQSGHIRAQNQIISDYLALAKDAIKQKDFATQADAVDGAVNAYNSWVASLAGSSSVTVTDWMTIGKVGSSLGISDSDNQAYAEADRKSNADLAKVMNGDPCTVKKGEVNCMSKKLATVALLGVGDGSEGEAVLKFTQAVKDRLDNKYPPGCEEWDFTLKLALNLDHQDLYVSYDLGSFFLDRSAETITPNLKAAPSPKGWNMTVHGGSMSCEGINISAGGQIVSVPATIDSGTFHYTLEGEFAGSFIFLSPTSSDVTSDIHVSWPTDVYGGCGVGDGFYTDYTNQVLRDGVPLIFDTSSGKSQLSIDENGETAIITQLPVVAP